MVPFALSNRKELKNPGIQAQHRQGPSLPHHPATPRGQTFVEMCRYTQLSPNDNQSCCSLLPDILAHGHGCNNLLYSFFPLLFLLIIELSLQFKNLSWQKTEQTELLGRAEESRFRDGSRGTCCFPSLFPLDQQSSTWKLTDLTENTGQGEPKL